MRYINVLDIYLLFSTNRLYSAIGVSGQETERVYSYNYRTPEPARGSESRTSGQREILPRCDIAVGNISR